MTDILYEELSKGVASNKFTLIDLRTKDEIKDTAKLPGAHCLPVQELPDAIKLSPEEFKDKYNFNLPPPESAENKSYVWYCRSGRRVGIAHDALRQAGYAGYRLYYGSYLDWSKHGGATEDF